MKKALGPLVLVILVSLAAGLGFSLTNVEQTAPIDPSRIDAAEQTLQDMQFRVDSLEQKVDAAAAQLGATSNLPDLKALFETSLASKITSSQTTLTLVSAADKAGVTLASSTYPFIIDEGTASEEFVLADCTGTTCTNVTRGVSVSTGTTSVTSLKKAHGRGASVKITDGPILLIHNRLLQGRDSFPNILNYVSSPNYTSASSSAIASKGYVDGVAIAGGTNASETVQGISELATTLEAASSTSLGGTGARLVLPASMATDTPSTVCNSTPCAVITKYGGKTISQLFLDIFGTANTWTAHNIFSSLFATNASTTNATSTHFALPGILSSVLKTDSNGKVAAAAAGTDYAAPIRFYTSTTQVSTTQTSSTTVMSVSVPANTLGTANAIRCEMGLGGTAIDLANTVKIWVEVAYGNSTTTASLTQSSGGSINVAPVIVTLIGNGSTNSQKIFISSTQAPTTAYQITGSGTHSVDSTAAQQFKVVARESGGGSSSFAPDAIVCTKIQ